MNEPSGGIRTFRVYRIARWWRFTDRAARRMVWLDLGWTHVGECQQRAGYTKAKIGYWVTLERWQWEPVPEAPAISYVNTHSPFGI